MVATWLTELYLDQINRALLDTHAGVDSVDASPVEQLEQQLQVWSWPAGYKDVPPVTHAAASARYAPKQGFGTRIDSINTAAGLQASVLHAACTMSKNATQPARAPPQAFLKANVEVVDPGVTAHLLASYGRMDDLMHFASYRQVCLHRGFGSGPSWVAIAADVLLDQDAHGNILYLGMCC